MADYYTEVESEHIKGYNYDRGASTLTIYFHKGGKLYRYHEVPASLAGSFALAKSKGSFFHENIRGRFRYTSYEDA